MKFTMRPRRSRRPIDSAPKTQSAPPTAEAERPLRIGVMLRGVGERDGAGVYIRCLLDALFERDRVNEYILFYDSGDQAGRWAGVPNVRERVIPGRTRLFWDQVSVPLAARREKLDVLFHHKFTIPLIAPCPTVCQQRAAEYWTMPEQHDFINRWYSRLMIPLYCRQARLVLTNSDTLASELAKLIGTPREKMRTVLAAPGPTFRQVTDTDRLAEVRQRYGLPEGEFFLAVVKGYAQYDERSRRLRDRKNVSGMIRAHAQLRGELPDAPPLVIVGPGIRDRLAELKDLPLDPDAVLLPGFVQFDDMPALYSMCTALVFPSFSESFGIPLVEAMASGAPVITSTAPACVEVTEGAALIVRPDSVEEIAAAMRRMVTEPELRADLRRRGLERAAEFSWARSADRLVAALLEATDRALPVDRRVSQRHRARPQQGRDVKSMAAAPPGDHRGGAASA